MSNKNPYKYETKEYYEYELKVAKLNFELVTEAATARIKNAPEETACAVATEMCNAMSYALESVSSAEYGIKRLSENNGNE